MFSVISGDSPVSLQILPDRAEITKSIGASLALTCKTNTLEPSQISQLEWRDPKNRRIESTRQDSSIYISVIFKP